MSGASDVLDWQPRTSGWQNHGLKWEEQLDDRFFVAYEVDEDAGTVAVAMSARSEGWIGFSPTGSDDMVAGNPCVVMEIDGAMEAVAMHSPNFMRFTAVGVDQNCALLEYESGNGETYAKIQRATEDLRGHGNGTWATAHYTAAWGDSQQFGYHGGRRAYLERSLFDGPMVGPGLLTPPRLLSLVNMGPCLVLPRLMWSCYGHRQSQRSRRLRRNFLEWCFAITSFWSTTQQA